MQYHLRSRDLVVSVGSTGCWFVVYLWSPSLSNRSPAGTRMVISNSLVLRLSLPQNYLTISQHALLYSSSHREFSWNAVVHHKVPQCFSIKVVESFFEIYKVDIDRYSIRWTVQYSSYILSYLLSWEVG